MHRILSHTAAAGALTAAALIGSLALAPAANAATHKITAGYSTEKESVKVGGHKDLLSITKASTKTVAVVKTPAGTVYTPTSYTVKLTDAHKKVLLKRTVSNWRALDAFLGAPSHSYKSDAALVKQVKHDLGLSNAAAKKAYLTLHAKVNAEIGVGFVGATTYLGVADWIDAHAGATVFDDTLPLTGKLYGYTYVIAGTPQAYTIRVVEPKTGLGVAVDSANPDKGKLVGKWVFGKFVEGQATYTINRDGTTGVHAEF